MIALAQWIVSKDRLDLASGIVVLLSVSAAVLGLFGGEFHWTASDVDWRSPLSAAGGVVGIVVILIFIWALQMVLLHGVLYWRWRYPHAGIWIWVAAFALAAAMPWGPLALYFVGYRRDREYDATLRAVWFPWMALICLVCATMLDYGSTNVSGLRATAFCAG